MNRILVCSVSKLSSRSASGSVQNHSQKSFYMILKSLYPGCWVPPVHLCMETENFQVFQYFENIENKRRARK